MRQFVLAGATLLSVALFAPSALAYSSPGSPSGFVNDFASVLSDGAKQSLETELTNFEKSTSNEITVVTVPNMNGDYIENYAVKLFEEWGIGKKNKDNGVLLLLSIEERKMKIETGYGLEGALPDSVAQSILNNNMTPLLKNGDYDSAVTSGVKAIEQATQGEYASPKIGSSFLQEGNIEFFFVFGLFILQFLSAILARSKSWWAGGVVGLVGGLGVSWILALGLLLAVPLVVLLAALGLLFDYIVSNAYQKSKASGISAPWWIGGGRGGGFGGGGFGGFGGGGSGGGGASGNW